MEDNKILYQNFTGKLGVLESLYKLSESNPDPEYMDYEVLIDAKIKLIGAFNDYKHTINSDVLDSCKDKIVEVIEKNEGSEAATKFRKGLDHVNGNLEEILK